MSLQWDYFPGDPPWSEFFGIVSLAFCMCILLIGSIVHLIIYKRRGLGWTTRTLAVFPFALFLLCGAKIVRRNFGEWGELKERLVTQDRELRAYVAAHPELAPKDAATEFGLQDEGPWHHSFSDSAPPVNIMWIMLGGEPRIATDFGHGATAVFDLNTMIVVYSD